MNWPLICDVIATWMLVNVAGISACLVPVVPRDRAAWQFCVLVMVAFVLWRIWAP